MDVEPIVPLISSSVAGPLGVLHLPRLWLKILLHATGRLPEGYRHGQGGFDGSLCERLGIDADAMIDFIARERPDYLALEAWIVEHARDLSSRTVAAFNQLVLTSDMGPENAAKARARFAVADAAFANAIALNNLDDWALAHSAIIAAGCVPDGSKLST